MLENMRLKVEKITLCFGWINVKKYEFDTIKDAIEFLEKNVKPTKKVEVTLEMVCLGADNFSGFENYHQFKDKNKFVVGVLNHFLDKYKDLGLV